MPKGSGHPLQLEVMNKLVKMFPADPTNFFSGLFPKVKNDSDAIEWEIEYGSAGLTPFVAPGAPAPMIGLDGTGEGAAKAAFWKEKMYLDETILNNLREPGSKATYMKAERIVSKGLRKLTSRMARRSEWMCAKAIVEGGFGYQGHGGTKLSVNYGIPATHQVTLPSDRFWGTGANRDPMDDIHIGVTALADDAGVTPECNMCTSNLLRTLMKDTKIQELLKKSTFGNGDLFRNPARVIGELMGVGTIKTYDGFYELELTPMAAIVGGVTTTVPVDDATDVEAGATARLIDRSEHNVWEDVVVDSVNIPNSTITFTAAPSRGFKVGETSVRVRKKFIDDDRFCMFSSKAQGLPIGEFLQAPFGVKRTWGLRTDRKEIFDPDGMIVRTTDKGLPTLERPDAIYTIKVR